MFEIMCKERFKEAMELSREHRDQTFSNCMMRLLSYLTWNNADKVRLTRDWMSIASILRFFVPMVL